jgi:hypothetical protein
MTEFWKVVYGPETMTITFVVKCSIEDLDAEVQRVLKLKGIRSAGTNVIMWSAENVPCPSGEWSSERYESIRQLELEHNVFLHVLSKEDADEALKQTVPDGLTSESWMQLRLEMQEDHYGLTGDDGQEYRFIEDVYEAMTKNRTRNY